MKRLLKTGIISLLAVFVAVTTLGVGTAYSATVAKKTPSKAPAAPAKIKWETKTTDKATLSIPSNWKQGKDVPPTMNAWYIGASTIVPDGAFVIMWEDVPLSQILSGGEATNVGPVNVCGVASTEYSIMDKASNFEGIAVIADKPAADGRRMIIAAGSATGQWKKQEPTLRKIVASIKLRDKPAAAK